MLICCAFAACIPESNPPPSQGDAAAAETESMPPKEDAGGEGLELGSPDAGGQVLSEAGVSLDAGPTIEAAREAPDGGVKETGIDARSGSGLARERLVGQLTPNEAAMLCDFTNLTQGGYGKKATCPGGEVEENDESLNACVSDFIDLRLRLERCKLTVGHMEDCARAVGTDLCKFATAIECEPLTLCM
jgi:hypothetical protein